MDFESRINWTLKKKGGNENTGVFPAFNDYFKFKFELRSV